jgi:pyrimidine-specific ribonucleoside hydrolase
MLTRKFRSAATCLVLVAVSVSSQTIRPTAVWIDADPAVGVKDRDVDDGFALLQAFHSPELRVRGVSIVFGNTSLERAWPIGQSIVRRFGPSDLHAYRGASAAVDLGAETDASRALANALMREPLVVVALGPATNVATVLRRHPELTPKIERVVAVAGRRPGQRFTTGNVNTNGHRDFNFEQDAEAFRVLLASGVPLTLAPFEISSKVWITGDDLDLLGRGPESARWMQGPARAWLALWKRTFAVDGFNPFDTLAIARVTSPSLLTCDTLPARIEVLADDVTEARMQGVTVPRKPYLLVSADFPLPAPSVEYCFRASESFKPDLLRRLTVRDRSTTSRN